MRQRAALAAAVVVAAVGAAFWLPTDPAGADATPGALGAPTTTPSAGLQAAVDARAETVGTRAVDRVSSPSDDVPALLCGTGPAMRFVDGPYVPLTDPTTAARSPEQALAQLLDLGYPNAPLDQLTEIERTRSTTEAVTKFTFSSNGRLRASFLATQTGGEHWIESWSICEATAKGWAR